MLMDGLTGDFYECILALFNSSMVSLVKNKLDDSDWVVRCAALNMLQLAAARSEVVAL